MNKKDTKGEKDKMGRHPLAEMIRESKQGKRTGMFSVCSANPYVIRAAVIYAKAHNCMVMIEATSNQVNQAGGYTGLTPCDYADLVHGIAAEEGVCERQIILGGDHLGPLVYHDKPEREAMEHAAQMVRAYTLAGYTKIHIDTSMRLGDDDRERPLAVQTAAKRGAALAAVVEKAYRERKRAFPDAVHPALVIGSEVPVPGGSTAHEDFVKPTPPEEFRSQVACFRQEFEKNGLDFAHVAAFVVQPGVEFGDDFVCQYDEEKAKPLMDALKDYEGFVFEGHSTDYQTGESLSKLVADGVAILKVGPALTFALREALFSLENIERECVKDAGRLSCFREILKKALDTDGRYWENYYFGTQEEIAFKKLFSFSDRCRYYLPDREVQSAIGKLLGNVEGQIKPAYISQYFPELFGAYQAGVISGSPESLLYGHIGTVLDRYAYGCGIQG